jgi:hypothetical protein
MTVSVRLLTKAHDRDFFFHMFQHSCWALYLEKDRLGLGLSSDHSSQTHPEYIVYFVHHEHETYPSTSYRACIPSSPTALRALEVVLPG